MRVLLLVAACLSTAVSAQVTVGVRAGYGGARYSQSERSIAPSAFRRGYAVGVFADVPAYRGVSVRPEIQYVQKGSRSFGSQSSFEEGVFEIEETLVELRVDYVEVPVLARLSSPAGGRFRVGLVAGPALSVRVRERAAFARYVNGTSAPYPPGTIAIAADFAPVDVGVVAGGDVSFGRVGLDVRYTVGLTEADAVRAVRNVAVSAALSYRVGL